MVIVVDGLELHYEMEGEGRPILMLHGWPLDYRVMYGCMEPIFKRRRGWKRIYLDLPGMGESKGVDWITTQDQMVEIVLNFVGRILPGQSFALSGLSYGGYLAQGIVFQTPQIIDGLALIATSVQTTRRTLPEKVTLVPDAALMGRVDPNTVEGFGYVSVVQNQRIYERWFEELEQGYRLRDDNFLSQITVDSFSFDPNKLAKPFLRPTLIITGRQDHFTGYRDQWEILENYPRATFVVLDRAGHMLYIEQENLFNALVNEWLDRIEEMQ
jgi:pimeloyl-ACP methyl ester carboxylesterase